MPFTRTHLDGTSPTIAAEAKAAAVIAEPPDVIEIDYPTESAATDSSHGTVWEELDHAGYGSRYPRRAGNVWIVQWVWHPTEFAVCGASVGYETAVAVLDGAGIPFVPYIDQVWRLYTSPRLFHLAQDTLRADPRSRDIYCDPPGDVDLEHRLHLHRQ